MDKIFINDLEVFARHGVYREENVLGQKFIVSAVMYVDTHPAGIEDELSKSVNYALVCERIQSVMKEHTYQLIEAAAEQVAQAVLMEFPLIRKIKLTLKKPWAPVLLSMESVGVQIKRQIHTVYLGIGSNMGQKQEYLDLAVSAVKMHPLCRMCQVSDYIVTKPWGYTQQEDFLNAAVKIETLLTPEELLEWVHKTEEKAGRERNLHWGPRTLDIDILFYDDMIYESEMLTVPHPQIPYRDFVLRPMAQIAPYFVHPLLQKTVKQLLKALDTQEQA